MILSTEKDSVFLSHITDLNIKNVKICAYIAIFLELFLLGRNIYYYGVSLHPYVLLYIAMFAASVGVIVVLSYLSTAMQDENRRLIYSNRIIFCYYLFTLVWGVIVTLFDLGSSGQITAFLINVLIASILYVNSSRTFVFLHIVPLLCLLIGMYTITMELKYVSNHMINITVFYIFAVLGSRRLYNYIQKSYVQEKTLQQNNIELCQLNKKLDKLANYDALTNLANRHYFQHFVEENCIHHQEVTVYLLDIDYFKLYNDEYGHIEGDAVLQKVAHTIQSITQQYSLFAARYGGEEFIILGFDLAPDAAQAIANEINKEIEHLQIPHIKSKASTFITVSIGFTQSKMAELIKIENLITKADEALYQAKNNGRNQNKIYPMPSPLENPLIDHPSANAIN